MYKFAHASGSDFALRGLEFSAYLSSDVAEKDAVIYSDDVQYTMMNYALAALGAKLMRADGPVNGLERKAFYHLFSGHDVEQSRLKTLLMAAVKDTASHLQYARQLAMLIHDEALKFEILSRLTSVAASDAPVTPVEFDVLCDIGQTFGFGRGDVARMVDELEGASEADPFELLGIDSEASLMEIQQAYRERMRYCHPDRWNKEAYRDMYRLSHRRSVAVNAAYEEVLQRRRLH